MTSGIPAFNNIPHDFNLSLNICQGLRPVIVEVPNIFDNAEEQKIFEDKEVEYAELMKRCWDPDPNKRPTAEDLIERFKCMRSKYYSNYDRIQVPGKI